MTALNSEPWWTSGSVGAEGSSDDQALREYADNVADEHVRPLLALGAAVAITGADGPLLRGVGNKDYIDLRSGGGVFSLGHRPTVVIREVASALARLDIGDWQLPSPLRTELAKDLSASMAGGTWQWRFFVSGSEGNEFALRTALMATDRRRLVALQGGYHGQTGLSACVTDEVHLGRAYPRMETDVVRVSLEDDSQLAKAVDERTAAVIIEPVQLTDAIRPVPLHYLQSLRRRCDDVDSLLIFDEVKCGLNRTGPLWAHHEAAVLPDMLVVGKALSGGIYPVAACGIRRDTSSRDLRHWRSDVRSSFGGSHLGMIAGRAALRELTNSDNQERFRLNGDLFEAKLRSDLESIPGWDGNLLRRGMAFEIDVHDADLALFVASDLVHRGVVVPFPKNQQLVLLPPLTMQRETSEVAATRIALSLASGRNALGL